MKWTFIVQFGNDIIPIEVKSGKSISSPSLIEYKKMYEGETPLVIRYSLKNLIKDGNVLNIPLFMIDQTERLAALAMAEGKKTVE